MTPEEKAAVAHASARAVSEVSDTVERVIAFDLATR